MMPQTRKGAISENDILLYLALGIKHLRLMVLLVCFSLTLGLVYYTFARPVYYSKALILFEPKWRPVDTQKVFHDGDRARVVWELESPHIIARTAKALGVIAPAPAVGRSYIKKLVVRPNSEGNIYIEVWPYSQEWAKRWAETTLREYLDWRNERRTNIINRTVNTWTNDMEFVKKKREDYADARFSMSNSNKMVLDWIKLNEYVGIPREITVINHDLGIMDQTLHDLENTNYDNVEKLSLLAKWQRDFELAKARVGVVAPSLTVGETVPKDDPNGILITPSTLASPVKQPWNDLDEQRLNLQQQYRVLGKTFKAHNPRMLEVQKQIDEVNRKLDLELEAKLKDFHLEYMKLVSERDALNEKLKDYDKVNHDYFASAREYQDFDASQLGWRAMYDTMAKGLTEMDVATGRERADLSYSGLIEFRPTPVSPNRLKLMVTFLLFGLALAIAIPFLIEYLDSRVSDVDQAEESLHLRSLGVVPKVTDVPLEETMTVDTDSKTGQHVQENFRLIRTNLIMNSASPSLPQVIVITSAMPLEGKTVVASNLALSFARKGEKTLLIDADLRRGRLHRVFAAPGKPGLSEVLVQNQPVEEVCRIIGNGSINGNLTLMPCGKHIHSASEYLDSPFFPKMIDDLRQKYQRIVIDTPPVLGLSETSIIQRVADGVMLVIWSGWTPMRDVKTAIQTLQTNGAKFSGFVLNRLDFGVLTNRYKYFYYSPYYYSSYRATEPPPPPQQLTAAE